MDKKGTDNRTELMEALSQITREKGIDKQIIYEAIETSLVSACKKNYGATANIQVRINEETGIQVVNLKEVVKEVEDENCQISIKEARKIDKSYNAGDAVEFEIAPKDFGRISAQTAKQVVVQKFREAEREILYNEYITKEHDILTGIVQRRDRRNVIVSLGKLEGVLPPGEQIPREPYNFQDRVKVYVQEVRQTSKGPVINVSRTAPELVGKLFEQEVPEVFDGTVEVKSVAREPGLRSKMAVHSKNPHVDPVGACVGQGGYRVNVISNELRGEKLDIINWNEDPVKYIAAALSPSRVNMVAINPYSMTAKVVVPDNQLSLAIGKEGQNARLAARLTGWRIDIKSESQARSMDFITDEELDVDYEEFLKEKVRLEAARQAAEEAAALSDEADEADEIEDGDLPSGDLGDSGDSGDLSQEGIDPADPATAASALAPQEGAPTPEGQEYDYYDDEEYYDDDYEYDDDYDDEYDDEYYDDDYEYDEYDDEYYDEAQKGTERSTEGSTEESAGENTGEKK